MARVINTRDISPILAAGEQWVRSCLIGDRSVFSRESCGLRLSWMKSTTPLWSIEAIRSIGHLAHVNDSIIAEFEEKAELSS